MPWKRLLRVWSIIRHFLSVRSLLDLLGLRERIVAILAASCLIVWAALRGLPAPILVLVALVAVMAVLIVLLIMRIWNLVPSEKTSPHIANHIESTEANTATTAPTAGILSNSPSVLVEYVKGSRPRLLLTNDKPRTAANVRLAALTSREPDGPLIMHEPIVRPSIISVVGAGDRKECEFWVIDGRTKNITSLQNVLRAGTEETLDVAQLNYEDSDNNKLSRSFTLTRHVDDNVSWHAGPVKLLHAERHLPLAQPIACAFVDATFVPQLGGGDSILTEHVFVKVNLHNKDNIPANLAEWELTAGNIFGRAEYIPSNVALIEERPKVGGISFKEIEAIEIWKDLRRSTERTALAPFSYLTGWLMFTINGFLAEHEEAGWILSCLDGQGNKMEFSRAAGPWPGRFRVQTVDTGMGRYWVSQAQGGIEWLK